LIGMRLGRAPLGGESQGPRANWSERADWWLQRHTQERSKTAWCRYGRRWGPAPFWLSMGDLVIAQFLLEALNCALSLARRIAKHAARVLRLTARTSHYGSP
jgi:hypothetical protein